MLSHVLQDTKDPVLKRVVDSNGDWSFYFHTKHKVYLNATSRVLSLGFPKDQRWYNYLLSTTKEEQQTLLAFTGERGSRIHAIMERIGKLSQRSRGGCVLVRKEILVPSAAAGGLTELTDDEWSYIAGLVNFWNLHEPVVHMTEFPVYSINLLTAGTPDNLMTLTKTCDDPFCGCKAVVLQPGLWDLKSTRAIYPHFPAQIASYHAMLYQTENKEVRRVIRSFGDQKIYGAILRLAPLKRSGYETMILSGRALGGAYKDFTSALDIVNRHHAMFTDADIVEIPDRFTLTVTAPSKIARLRRKEKKVRHAEAADRARRRKNKLRRR